MNKNTHTYKPVRSILSLRLLVFFALLPVALLLFLEGKKYPMGRVK